MNIADYKRGIRAMNDLRPSSKAALIFIVTEKGESKLTTLGEPQEFKDLVFRLGTLLDESRKELQK